MAKTYRPYLPDQDFLLPPSPRDWLPEGHLAYFVSDVVEALDLSAITTPYERQDRGYPPYHPVMLTKVLVYAYCVGVFSSRGGAFESEIWGDLEVMGPAFNRSNGYSSLTLKLKNPGDIEKFNEDLKRNPSMQVEAMSERQFYDNQAGGVATALLALAGFVAVVMGIGAVFGAMNTMYGIVSARTREIGTLRALGFSRISILVSFVLESTFLAVVGALLGCLVALPANGMTSSAGGANFAEVAFAFKISTFALGVGIAFGAVMGIVGGLLPAVKAARLPITTALREA